MGVCLTLEGGLYTIAVMAFLAIIAFIWYGEHK